MSDFNPKRRRLNYEKCECCRRDKQKCTPVDRKWPGQKCDWCIRQGLPCGTNTLPGRFRDRRSHSVVEEVVPSLFDSRIVIDKDSSATPGSVTPPRLDSPTILETNSYGFLLETMKWAMNQRNEDLTEKILECLPLNEFRDCFSSVLYWAFENRKEKVLAVLMKLEKDDAILLHAVHAQRDNWTVSSPRSPNTKLLFLIHVAIRHGKWRTIRQEVYSVSSIQSDEALLLALARMCPDDPDHISELLSAIEALLGNESVGVNHQHEGGRTPLMVAMKHGAQQTVDLLLAQPGIDVNAKARSKTRGPKTALSIFLYRGRSARKEGREGKLAALVRHPLTDVNTRTIAGYTPLAIAVASSVAVQCSRQVEILLTHESVDVNARCVSGATALGSLTNKGNVLALEILLQAERLQKASSCVPPPPQVYQEETAKILNLLLRHPRIDINDRDADGRTLLMLAVRNGYVNTARLLLTKNTLNHECQDPEKHTALHYAVDNFNRRLPNSEEILRMLLNDARIKLHVTNDVMEGMVSGPV